MQWFFLQEELYLFVTVADLVVTDYDISAQVGDPAFFTCNVTSIPPGTTTTYHWRRADMSSISGVIAGLVMYLPRVGVSDAGVYICEVDVNDPSNNPYVIPQNGLVCITLTVTSK